MSPPRATRRSLLRTGGTIAAVLGTGGLAGCVEGLGNSGTAGRDPLADVPATADAVVTVDVNTFFADDGVRNTYNAWLETRAEMEYYDGPETLDGTLDDFEEQEGVDLRDLSRFVGFFSLDGDGNANADDGTGYVFEGAWDVEDLVGVFDHDYVEFEESAYAEHTVYEPDDEHTAHVGVLEEGKYVAGGPDAVRDAIDVERDEVDPIDGPVANAYGDAQAGPIRFATNVRADWFPEGVEEGDISLDLSPLRSVETAAGSIYRDGSTRGLRVALNAPDGSTAEELESVVNGFLTLASGQAEQMHTPDYIADLLEDVVVGRDGGSVALSVERTVDELEKMARQFGDTTSGSASGSGSDSATATATPQASFSWDYDGEAQSVTVTHTAGDTLDAEKLGIGGEGFADVAGVDLTQPGYWAEGADDEEVMAGDSITIGVEPDCWLFLNWEGENQSAVLARYEGPEA